MNINAAIDKTFYNAEMFITKKTTSRLSRLADIDDGKDDNFYSNFLQKIKDDDNKNSINKLKPRKSEQFTGNLLDCQSKTHSKEICNSSRKSAADIIPMHTEEIAKSSNLHPRKLKKEPNHSTSNMLLVIPGMNPQQNQQPKKKNTSVFGNTHRKPSNVSNIRLKDLREEEDNNKDKDKGDKGVITETIRSNVSNVFKIMIPQSEKFKEFGEELKEEANKVLLEVQSNAISFEVMGSKQPQFVPIRNFIFDSLKIQKLNSINELGSKKSNNNDDLQKSMLLLNNMKGNNINKEHNNRVNQRESQIIIINQNEFNRFPLDQTNSNTKQSKPRMFCCIPVK